MAVEGNKWRALKGFLGPAVSAAVLLAAVGGCSRVPDAINPVEWYKDTTEFFAGEDDKKPAATDSDKKQSTLAADRGKPPPGAGKPAPNLGSFPDRPPVTRAEQSRLAAQGLVSDREGRRYSSESIRRQSEPVEALAPSIEAAMPDAPAAPPPPAMPTARPSPAAPPPMAAPAAPSVPMAVASASPTAAAVPIPSVTAPPSSRVRETRQARPVRPPPAPKTPATEAKTAPAYNVQLAAVRSLERAQGEWERLRRKNSDLLGKLALSVTKADLGPEKGVFYRLRVGPVADEADARALCANLAKHEMGCLVVRPGG